MDTRCKLLAAARAEASLPVAATWVRAWFKMNPAGLKAAENTIEEGLDVLDQRLASLQGDYLVGDRFSFADITACALLGPLFGPPQHPMWSDPTVRAMFEPIGRQWRNRPVAEWVLERYAKDRGAWRNPLALSISAQQGIQPDAPETAGPSG